MVVKAVCDNAQSLRLYPDPECRDLGRTMAEAFGIEESQIIMGNGSDEVLAFIFQAFCAGGAAFPDITYGFYKVWAQLYGIKTKVLPLMEDFTINLDDYRELSETLIIANPNAPTGIAHAPKDILELLRQKPDRLVVVDEAYVDFGAESCLPYINDFDNLLVVQTFSKSRNLAGGRVAFAAGNRALIDDLNRIKFSFHPYNMSRISQAAGIAAVKDRDYYNKCISNIRETRERAAGELKALGFEMTASRANFLFVRHPSLSGLDLYTKLREKGVLVRYFGTGRILDYVRITIGSGEEMDALINAVREIL
jgi:Histidinol-phosphate/aromatic aminotransferase and cobyric acid decarboxylase